MTLREIMKTGFRSLKKYGLKLILAYLLMCGIEYIVQLLSFMIFGLVPRIVIVANGGNASIISVALMIICYILEMIIIMLLINPMYIGYCGQQLSAVKDENFSVSSFLGMYKKGSVKLSITYVLASLYYFLLIAAPIAVYFGIVAAVYRTLTTVSAFILALLFFIPLFAFVIHPVIQLSFVPYILAEAPRISMRETLSRARSLTKNNIIRTILLNLCFVGLWLLLVVVIGVILGVTYLPRLILGAGTGTAITTVFYILEFFALIIVVVAFSLYFNLAYAAYYRSLKKYDDEEDGENTPNDTAAYETPTEEENNTVDYTDSQTDNIFEE